MSDRLKKLERQIAGIVEVKGRHLYAVDLEREIDRILGDDAPKRQNTSAVIFKDCDSLMCFNTAPHVRGKGCI